MAISFNQIPANVRVPFVFVEFDSSLAVQGLSGLPYRAILIGQKLPSGTMAANTFERITSADQARIKAGEGSMLHRMARSWFANNSTTELYLGALADDQAGVKATGGIGFSGPATAAGTIALYLGGERVTIGVSSGDTGDMIAEAVKDAINATPGLPVTASIDPLDQAKVHLEFRHAGTVGNGFDIRLNYYAGETLPAGVSATIEPMSDGLSDPDPSDLLAALGDEWFHIWAMPYTSAPVLAAVETELASRFGPMRMIDGVCVTASAGSHSDLGTLGNSRNSPHVSIVATNQSPTPVFEYAAAVAAVAAYYGEIDPARPFQTLPLTGVLAPAEKDRFTLEERNLLLYDGISTTKVDAGGVVRIERLITTYKENEAGAPDTAYLDVNTLLTLMYLRYDFRNYILRKYPRHKLASDGVRVGPGQAIITPKIGKAEAIMRFMQWMEVGLVEGLDQFKDQLIVERNPSDPNRLDFMLPPDLVNQFRVAGVKISFLL